MNVFEEAAVEYDEWFETHTWVYQSEIAAVRKFKPFKPFSEIQIRFKVLNLLKKVSGKGCL